MTHRFHYGWIVAAHQVGGAFAAWAGGFIHTSTGNYLAAFIGAGLLCLFASALVLFIGRDVPANVRQRRFAQ